MRSPARDTSRRTDGGRDVGVVGSTDGLAPHVHGTTMRPPVWERTVGRAGFASWALSVALTAATVLCRRDAGGGGQGNGAVGENRSGSRQREGAP
eukprot:2470811-Pleurochrysis_carterae.AAC.1